MTNKQWYQRTFSSLHASERSLKEVTTMKQTRRIPMRRLRTAFVAAVLAIAMASVAYATDLGGIQRSIQIWTSGELTNAVLEIQDGTYTVTYQDEDGDTREIGGGGIAYNADGSTRALTEEEILEELNSPNVEYLEDGTVWVYYHDDAVEITDLFDEDGVCYVQINTEDGPIYLTVEYQDGFSYSSHSYPEPSQPLDSTDDTAGN